MRGATGMLIGLLGAVLVLTVLVNALAGPTPSAAGDPFTRPTPPAGVVPRSGEGPGGGLPWPLGRGGRALGGVFALPHDWLGGVTLHLASLLTLLPAGFLVLYAMPARLGRIIGALGGGWRQWLRLVGLGLAAGLLALAFGVLSVLTIAGPPISLTLIALTYVGSLIGLVAVSLPLGRWISRRWGLAEQPPPVDLLAGLLGLFLISLIPFLGVAILAAAALLGLGATIQTRFGSSTLWTLSLPELDY